MAVSIDTFLTDRLSAERITAGHFEDIRQLHRDPDVMKTLSADGRPLPDEVTRQGLTDAVEHWERNGFGLWVFRDRANGEFVGRGGLKIYQIDGRDVVGLAYAVVSKRFGRGFATEMAEASLKIGFERLGLPEIDCWTLPINRASQRVMAKLGYRYEGEFMFAGLPHWYYRLSVSEWDAWRSRAQP